MTTMGIDPAQLEEEDLLRELRQLHSTRTDALLHGSAAAFARHTSRTNELESEYLRRYPERDVDPGRLRDGARRR
ncbi:DUF6158 family protein [Nonomuraea sp. NPDC050680]|uniref:DUF6158 family protein n=1 Tax=Nonomuraea sp. NPDC050680 TaxID=3154630 RepID=UPI0034117AA0